MDNRYSPHKQGLAAVLSFFFPGVGQIYKGQIFRGIFYFLLVSGLYATVILIPLALFFHLFIIYGAYQIPRKREKILVDRRRFNRLDDI